MFVFDNLFAYDHDSVEKGLFSSGWELVKKKTKESYVRREPSWI